MTVNALANIVSGVQNDTGMCFSKVNSLEVEVKDIGAKLDILISRLPGMPNAPAPVATPAATNSTVVQAQVHSHASASKASTSNSSNVLAPITPINSNVSAQAHIPVSPPQCPLPPPQELVRHENRDGRVDHVMSREEYRPIAQGGKHNIAVDNEMPKPYMYLEREGLQTVKQRLDVRNSITSNEYIHASLSLLRDTESYDPSHREHIFNHIHDVSADILVRPWAAVRRWTQYVWDSVSKGKCKWSDDRYIQDARFRLAYTSGPTPAPHSHAAGNSRSSANSDMRSVLCRDFNGSQGCRFQYSHDDGNVKYLHSCYFCDSIGRKSSHSFQRCRTRNDHGQQAGHASANSWNPAPGGNSVQPAGGTPAIAPGQYMRPPPNMYQSSKNSH